MVALRRAELLLLVTERVDLSTLATDAAGQLDVLGHDGDTLGVDGTQVGVLEETHQVSLRGLLQSHDGRGLESEISLEVLGNLTHQALEGQLPDEELGALLVTTDLTKSHGARPVTVRLLDSSSGRGRLASSLGGQLLARGLASGTLTGGLLGTSHRVRVIPAAPPFFPYILPPGCQGRLQLVDWLCKLDLQGFLSFFSPLPALLGAVLGMARKKRSGAIRGCRFLRGGARVGVVGAEKGRGPYRYVREMGIYKGWVGRC